MPTGWRITAGDMRLTTLLRDDRTLSAETGASLSKVVLGPFVVTVQEGLLDGGFSSGIPPEICYINVSHIDMLLRRGVPHNSLVRFRSNARRVSILGLTQFL